MKQRLHTIRSSVLELGRRDGKTLGLQTKRCSRNRDGKQSDSLRTGLPKRPPQPRCPRLHPTQTPRIPTNNIPEPQHSRRRHRDPHPQARRLLRDRSRVPGPLGPLSRRVVPLRHLDPEPLAEPVLRFDAQRLNRGPEHHAHFRRPDPVDAELRFFCPVLLPLLILLLLLLLIIISTRTVRHATGPARYRHDLDVRVAAPVVVLAALAPVEHVHALVVEEAANGRVGLPVVGDGALAAHGEGEGGGFEEDGHELVGLRWGWGWGGRAGQEGGEELEEGGVEGGEGAVEGWGVGGGGGEVGEDFVGPASLAVEAWYGIYVRFLGFSDGFAGDEEGKECTVSVDQLHIQLPQLPQLLIVGPKHLVRKHVHLEHLAQYAIDEQRSLLVEDTLPRPLLPATRYPVSVFHQFRGGVG